MSDSVKAILDKYRANNGPVSRRELSASMAKKLEGITPKYVPQDPEPKVNPNEGNVNYIDHSQNPTATRLQEMQPSDWATGDNVRNYVNAAAGGVTQAVGGFNAFVGNMTAAVPNAIDLARGGDGVSTDEWINTIGKKTGNYAAKDWLQKQKTHETLQNEAKLQAILSDPNKGEWEKAGETVGFYLKNPNFLAQEATKVTAQSILEMGGWGKVIGAVAPAASVATRAGIASGMGAYSGGVAEVAANPNKELTARSQFAQLAKGFVVGGITGGVSKYMPANNIDNVLVGGGVGQFGKGGLTVSTIKAALQEGGEEFNQEYLEAIIDNIDDKNPAFYNALAMGAQGFMLGAASSGGMSAFVNTPGAVDQTGVGVMSAIQDGLSKRKAAKEGTAEQQSNPESDKYNPAKVFNQSLVDARSSDPAVRAAAEENIALTSARAHAKLAEYTDAIENETNTETKTKLKAEREYYVERIMDPLIERIVANQNAIAANKDSEGADNYDSLVAEYRKLSQMPSPTPVEQPIETSEVDVPVQLTTPVVGAPVTPSTPLKRAVNPKDNQPKVAAPKATGKSLASIIQGGESGAAAHSAVNYGTGKAKGNLDPTRMTVGSIKKGLSNGEFVAVGKYQFHKSSFAEMAKKLPWVNDNTVLTAEVQDRIFAEHYVGSKRKGLGDYIRGGKTSLASANDALAQEWQAAQGSQGKGLLGAGATIKTADIQAGLVQSRAIYKEMKGKGATDAQAMLAAVTGGLGSNSQAVTKTRNPSRYISYGNSNSKRNEKLDSNLEQKLGFLEDMGVTFKVNSGGQSATSKGKVGSTAHNHGHAGDGDLYHKGRKLSFNDVNDRAMLADIIEEAAANGINGIGAGYMGDGRIHFGTQTKSAAWGGGKDASAPAYAWVAQAHARGLARKPSGGGGSISTTSNTGPAYLRSEASSIESTKRLDTKVTSLIDNTDMTAEEIVNTDPKEAKRADVGERIMSSTRNMYSTLTDEEIEKHPLLSTEQKDALRKMNEIKLKAAKNTTTNEVSRVIREGKQGPTKIESDMGTKQYQEAIDRAIATNDGRTAKRYLGQLDTFVENQISKARVIEDNIDTAKGSAPLFVAPDSKGIWSVVSEEVSKTPEFKEAGGLSFWGRNELSDAIADDAVYLDEFRSGITNVAAALVKGIKPIPQAKGATPLDVDGKGNKIDGTPTPTPTSFKHTYTKVKSADEAVDGVYLGRGPKNVSMSQVVNGTKVNLENIGKPGWLASSENKGTKEEKMTAYISKFKANVSKHDEFAQGVIELKGKKLYAHEYTAALSETSFIDQLVQVIPTDLAEAKKFISTIDSFNTEEGIVFNKDEGQGGVPPVTPVTPIDPLATGSFNDDSFGFNETNERGLNIYTDNSLAANKVKIDEVIASLGDPSKVEFPGAGLGAKLATQAPRSFKYLNERLSEVFGVDNQQLLANAPREVVAGRSAAGKINPKSNKGLASNPIKALGLEIDPENLVKVDVTQVNNLEENLELMTKLQPDLMSNAEAALHKNVIAPLLNFIPNMNIQLSVDEETSFNGEANLIKINLNDKDLNIMDTIGKTVISNTTNKIADALEGKKNSEMEGKSEELIQLNKDLADIKREVTSIGTEDNAGFAKLSDKAKVRFKEGTTSNANMLRLLTTDIEIVGLLQSVVSKGSKTKSSIFRRITDSLRSFLNIAPQDEVSTLYDKLLEATARAATEQAKNSEVKFEPSVYGLMSVFQDLIPEQVEAELAKPFKQRNHLIAGFTQEASKGKPLTSISNLSSKMKLDIMQGLGILNTNAPTAAQRKQIEDFLKFNDEFQVHIKDVFNRKGKSKDGLVDFAYEDLKGFVGIDDENTLTAISLGAYSWAVEYGSGNLSPDKTIKKFLNASEEDSIFIPPNIRSQYEYMTDLKTYTTDKIGATIVGALNVKATEELEGTAQSNFQNSMGEWAVSAMQAANLIHIETMNTDTHIQNIEAIGMKEVNKKGEAVYTHNENGLITFISLSSATGNKKNERMSEIAHLSKNTVGYMSEVFGTEIGLRPPQLKVPKKVIVDQKRTVAKTGKAQVKFMKKMQEEPIEIDVDMLNGLKTLVNVSREDTLSMIGAFVSEADLAKEHKEDRNSVLAAAEGVLRDYESGLDFIGGLEEQEDGSLQPFYDQVYAAKNNRMHYLSNMFNFQSSLLHRAMGQYKNFKSKVNINDDIVDKKGKLTNYALFMKSIAEQAEGTEKLMEIALKDTPYTLGFTQDKIPGEVFVPVFEEYLNTDKTVLAAVEATKVLLANPDKLTKEQAADIAALVKAWDMQAGSLRALIEYTKFATAKANGETTITTSMGLGSDGVNNGIALANVILGTANQSFLNQVGMYTKNSSFNNYFQSRTDSTVKDYYENFATIVKAETDKLLESFGKGETYQSVQLNALLNLNTSFRGRKNMKAILIPFGYSAGMKRLKQLAYGQFLADVKSTMKTISKEGKDSDAMHTALKSNLEVLLGHEIDLPKGQDILEFWFEYKDIKTLEQLYIDAVGDVIENSLNTYAGDFMKTRDLNIRIQNVAAEAYLTMATKVKELAEQEYKADFNISDEQYALEGMPVKYYDKYLGEKLNALRPTIKAPLNHKSDEPESNFVVLSEFKRMAAGKGNSRTNRVNEDGLLVPTTTSIAVAEMAEKSAGVGPNSSQVQGMDAYIAARTSAQGGTVNINIHDAGISGFNNFTDMVLEQNKATYEGLRDYSSLSESLASLIKVLTDFNGLVEQGILTRAEFDKEIDAGLLRLYGKEDFDFKKGTLENVVKMTTGENATKNVIRGMMLEVVRSDVVKANNDKIEIIKNLKTVHQYAGENGEYHVPADDSAAIAASIKSQEEALKGFDEMIDMVKFPKQSDETTTYVIGEKGDKRFDPKSMVSADNKNFLKTLNEQVKGLSKKSDRDIVIKELWKDYLISFPSLFKDLQAIVKNGSLVNSNPKDPLNTAEVLTSIVKDGLKGFTTDVDMDTHIRKLILEADEQGTPTEDIQRNLLNHVVRMVKAVNPSLTISFRDTQSPLITAQGKNVAGYYNLSMNHIVFNNDKMQEMAVEGQLALIAHEMLHSLNIGYFVKEGSKTNDPAIKELIKMRSELVRARNKERKAANTPKDVKTTIDYALEDISELISYGLTDPHVMAWLAENLTGKYNVETKQPETYLEKFISNVINFFSTSPLFKRAGETNPEGLNNFLKLVELSSQVAQALTEEERIQVGLGSGKNSYSQQATNPSDTLKRLSSGNVSSEFNTHLDGLLDTVGVFYQASNERKATVDAVIAKVDTKALKAGFMLSDKEMYAHDVLKAIAKAYLDNHSGSKSVIEMNKIFHKATKQLTYKNFLNSSNPTQGEVTAAKKKLDYILGQRGKNKGEQFERFYSLAMTSEEFGKVLSSLDMTAELRDESTLLDKFMNIFTTIMNWLTDNTLKTHGTDAPANIKTLFNRLAEIDNRALNRNEHIIDRGYTAITEGIMTPTKFVTTKIYDAIMPKLDFSNSESTSLQALTRFGKKVKRTGVMANVDTLIDNASANSPSGRLHSGAEFLNELTATKGMKQTVEGQIRAVSLAGQNRDTVLKKTKSAILKAFSNDGKDLSSKDTKSLTVALRSDMSSLMNNGFSVTSVMKLLKDKPARKKEIAKREANILKNVNGNDIVMQTKSLALYMAREVAVEHLVKNAEGIAIGLGSWYQSDMPSMDKQLRDDIDVLASLYAMDMSPAEELSNLKDLINKEPEGIKAVLQFHKDLANNTREDFEGNPYNFIKGYMPQKTHHLRSLKFVSSQEERASLLRQGWEEVTEGGLIQDKDDATLPKSLMFHNDMVYRDYVSGALDMKDTHSKGTEVYNQRQHLAQLRKAQSSKMAARKRRANLPHVKYNPFTSSSNTMVAAYDAEGQLKSFSYEMTGHMRDTYLERNNNAVELLGMYNSNLHFKPEIKETQEKLADELYQDFKDNYRTDPRKFVILDPNSSDPNVVTMWRMMPYAFQQRAEAHFGKGQPITVRSNVYNSVFGFKTYSMAEMFDKVSGEKNALEKIMTDIMTAVFQDKAQMRVVQGERIWQGTVTQIKDFIVIRNINVLWSNVVSNALLLALHGVKPVQQGKDLVTVWVNGKKYRSQAARIAEIEAEIAVNGSRAGNISKLKRERTTLELEMSRNPLHKFMEAGLMSTIVEDVQVGKDDESFKSDFDKKLETITDNIPEAVKTTFNWAIMSPGTPLHEFMAGATQYSDLAAKYSLTTQLMREGKSMEDAIAVAQDNFINYDVPTSKGLDYGNKMGLFMFTKFFLRFQQVMLSRLNANATGTVMQHLLVEQFTGESGVLDPFALSRIGNNPFSVGPLAYDDAFNSISTVDFISSVLK